MTSARMKSSAVAAHRAPNREPSPPSFALEPHHQPRDRTRRRFPWTPCASSRGSDRTRTARCSSRRRSRSRPRPRPVSRTARPTGGTAPAATGPGSERARARTRDPDRDVEAIVNLARSRGYVAVGIPTASAATAAKTDLVTKSRATPLDVAEDLPSLGDHSRHARRSRPHEHEVGDRARHLGSGALCDREARLLERGTSLRPSPTIAT
jgi:hypothetical protein